MSLFKTFISIFMMFVSIGCIAAPTSIFPRGCEVSGFDYRESYLVFNETGNQSYYLVQNHSNSPIELQRHDTQEVFMSPPLIAKISPANWAAFASDIGNLHFQCFVNENESNKQVDCRDVLEVCQYPRVKFALSNMGNYWVSINKTQEQVIQDSTSKGIYLRW